MARPHGEVAAHLAGQVAAFEVDDMEAFAKQAAAKGYPLSDGPHRGQSNIIAFIDAPEGYEVELIQPL